MKKQKNKQVIKASKLAKAENMKKKVITVQNAEGEPETQVEILIQNKIGFTPKVSVIIPVYNVEEYLRECLDSIVKQTLREIEIICVDDGSTDNSLEILKEYALKDNRITVMVQENSGSGKSRNNGINNAKGEFIAFMDSDDFYPSHKTLENMHTKACKYNVNICGGSLNQLKDGKIITDPKLFEDGYIFEKEGIINYKDYQFDYGYWRFIYKRQFLKKNQLYFPDYLRQQDPPFFIKAMATAQQFYALTEATYVYRVSHKVIQWTERKAFDMFQGIEDGLKYSLMFNLKKLHIQQALRINAWTFRTALAETIKYDKVRKQAQKAVQTIDVSLLKQNGINLKLDCIYSSIIENNIFISVIIPVYNAEKYLNRCIDSVLNQTLTNIEIICINDGSTDKSLDILEKYAQQDKRIKIITQKNKGLSAARNTGIKQANCPFIYFIDSDDWIEHDTLEKAISKMTGDIDIVSWGANIINEGLSKNNRGIIIGREYHKIKLIGQKNIDENIILQSTYTVWNKLFKKEIINKFKLKFAEGKLFEDNDFTIMYMLHCRQGYYLGEYLYNYSQRPNSIMEKVRALKCDKTIDNLYIFDNLYKHCQTYNILERWKKLLTCRYLIHLRNAYIFAPESMRKQIRQEASKLAKHYKAEIFTSPVVSKLQKKEYSKIREVNEIIISLTSYPARIHTVNQTIESLLNQTMKADKVILWLAPEQFPNKEQDLPLQLLELKEKGLTIDWYHDIKSYKKLIPTLKKYPEDIIITVDDDAIYTPDLIKELYMEHTKNPQDIQCCRAHKIKIGLRNILPYKKWEWFNILKTGQKGYNIFFTGLGGVLYPPHCLNERVFNEKKIMDLCPIGDDIWFWAHALLKKTKINIIKKDLRYPQLIIGTQENALWRKNVENDMNDIQIHAIIKEYPEILQYLKVEKQKTIYMAYSKLVWNLGQYYKLKNNYETAVCRQLKSMRIDIKNFGKADNNIDIMTTAKTFAPAWFTNEQGHGYTVESMHKKEILTLKCSGFGKLRLDFKAADKRCNGKRFPLWVDYKSIKINGKEILSVPVETWHDKPFRYEMPVKDGQVVKVEVMQQYHQYSKDELKDVILKLNPSSDYIRENINKLTNKIYREITERKKISWFSKKEMISSQQILASIAALNSRIEKLEKESHLQQEQILEAIKALGK